MPGTGPTVYRTRSCVGPRRRAITKAYAVIPGATGEPLGDLVRLHQRRPGAVAGQRLVQLRLDGGQAIDVVASVARLARLTAVRSRLDDLRAAGTAFVLPCRSYDRAVVTAVFDPDGDGWRQRGITVHAPLTSFIDRGTRH